MTKRKLASVLCKLEGKKSQVAMSNMMEVLTVLENYFAACRVKETPHGLQSRSDAEFAMSERITIVAIKARKKMDKKNG